MSVANIKDMSVSERLVLLEEILDSFRDDEDLMNSLKWHEDILSKRREKFLNENIEAFSLQEVKDKLERV